MLLAFDGDEAKPEQARKTKDAAIAAHASAGRSVRAVQAAAGFDFNSWMAEVKQEAKGREAGNGTAQEARSEAEGTAIGKQKMEYAS